MKFFKKYWTIPVFILTVVIAFLLRSRMFLHEDLFFLPDQGRDLALVKQIVVDHKLTLIGGHTGGFGGLFHGPLWWYLIVPFFAIFRGDPFWTLVPLYVIISLGIVVVGGFCIGKLYGKSWGLLFAAFLAISHFLATTILFTSNAQPMPLVFLFYAFCMMQYLRGKNFFFTLAFLAIGLGIHFEVGFAIVLIPVTLIAIFLRRPFPSVKIWISAIAILCLCLSTYIVFDLRHQFLQTKSLLSLLSGHQTLTTIWDQKYNDFWYRLSDRWSSFLSLFLFPTFKEDVFSQALNVGAISLGGICYTWQVIRRKLPLQEGKDISFLLIVLIVSYVFYMIIKVPLQAHYTISLGVAIAMLFVLSLRKITQTSKHLGLVFIIITLLYQLFPIWDYLHTNYIATSPYEQNSNGSLINQIAVVDSVFKDAQGKRFGYFVFDPPIVTYGMDYLFWWRGTQKYGFVPESKKLPLTYLILNPPVGGDLHAHDFWQKYTVRTSAPVDEKWLMTGEIIVKRLSIDPLKEESVNPNYYQNFIFR